MQKYLFAIFLLLSLTSGLAVAASAESSSALIEAAKTNELSKAKSLLNNSKTNINAQDSEGMTALMQAAIEGNVPMTKLLLSKKAQLELKNLVGDTALAVAVGNDQYDVARVLVKNGADADILMGDENKETLFMRSFSSDRNFALIILKKNPKVINKTDALGETALFDSARYGSAEDVKILLKKGASKKLINKAGKTALDAAKEANNSAAIKLLKK